MKTITRDTVRALFAEDNIPALKLCGYTDKDIENPEAFYNALYDAPNLLSDFVKVTTLDGLHRLIRRSRALDVEDFKDHRGISMVNRMTPLLVMETLETLEAML